MRLAGVALGSGRMAILWFGFSLGLGVPGVPPSLRLHRFYSGSLGGLGSHWTWWLRNGENGVEVVAYSNRGRGFLQVLETIRWARPDFFSPYLVRILVELAARDGSLECATLSISNAPVPFPP